MPKPIRDSAAGLQFTQTNERDSPQSLKTRWQAVVQALDELNDVFDVNKDPHALKAPMVILGEALSAVNVFPKDDVPVVSQAGQLGKSSLRNVIEQAARGMLASGIDSCLRVASTWKDGFARPLEWVNDYVRSVIPDDMTSQLEICADAGEEKRSKVTKSSAPRRNPGANASQIRPMRRSDYEQTSTKTSVQKVRNGALSESNCSSD